MKALFLKIFPILVLMLSLAACASPSRNFPLADGPDDYTVGVGDVVRVNVFGQENLSGEFAVEQNGTISLPLVKEIPAAGQSTAQLEKSITKRLKPDYVVDPRVSVEIASYRSIFVLGEVRQPGQYQYQPNMSVMQAIATAGGFTYRAKESASDVTRHVKGAQKTFTVDNRALLKGGDTVYVGRRWF